MLLFTPLFWSVSLRGTTGRVCNNMVIFLIYLRHLLVFKNFVWVPIIYHNFSFQRMCNFIILRFKTSFFFHVLPVCDKNKFAYILNSFYSDCKIIPKIHNILFNLWKDIFETGWNPSVMFIWLDVSGKLRLFLIKWHRWKFNCQ